MSDENNITFTWDSGSVLRIAPGVMQINVERIKQIDKYGFSSKWQAENPQYYDGGQLIDAAVEIVMVNRDGWGWEQATHPNNWDPVWFRKLCIKSPKDRIRIAAALLAAELDRLDYLENKEE